MGRSGIRAAYATGRGRVCVRARTEFEEFGNNRTRIIVTEIPYQVNKRMLIKSMADQVEDCLLYTSPMRAAPSIPVPCSRSRTRA